MPSTVPKISPKWPRSTPKYEHFIWKNKNAFINLDWAVVMLGINHSFILFLFHNFRRAMNLKKAKIQNKNNLKNSAWYGWISSKWRLLKVAKKEWTEKSEQPNQRFTGSYNNEFNWLTIAVEKAATPSGGRPCVK